MNDTVVIYDRVRENLKKYSDIKIFELSNISINEEGSLTRLRIEFILANNSRGSKGFGR